MPRSLEDQLRKAIRDSGMPRCRIARAARMDGGTLSEFMLGKQESVRLKTAQKLAKVLGLRLALEPAPGLRGARHKVAERLARRKKRRKKST